MFLMASSNTQAPLKGGLKSALLRGTALSMGFLATGSVLPGTATAYTCTEYTGKVFSCTGDFSSGIQVPNSKISSANALYVSGVTSNTVGGPFSLLQDQSGSDYVGLRVYLSQGQKQVISSSSEYAVRATSSGNGGSTGINVYLNGAFSNTSGSGFVRTTRFGTVSNSGRNGSSTGSGGQAGSGTAGADAGGANLALNVSQQPWSNTGQTSIASGNGNAVWFHSLAGSGGNGGNSGGNAGAGGKGGSSDTLTLAIGGTPDITNGVGAVNITGAVVLQSSGGDGGHGGNGGTDGQTGNGGNGADGGAAGGIKFVESKDTFASESYGSLVISSGERAAAFAALSLLSTGGSGGNGGSSTNFQSGSAGAGGSGGAISMVNVQSSAVSQRSISAQYTDGIRIYSQGGAGGTGGGGGFSGYASNGGTGGEGGAITVAGRWNSVETTGPGYSGLVLRSLGGAGGDGGVAASDNKALPGNQAGTGGVGGNASTVELQMAQTSTFKTTGTGIDIASVGGAGGTAGAAGKYGSKGGKGGNGYQARLKPQSGATPSVNVRTSSNNAPGISVVSQGGYGGPGSLIASINSASGGKGGDAAFAYIATLSLDVATTGNNSPGIVVASLGGNGGKGGQTLSGSVTGGTGGAGGTGPGAQLRSAVNVTTTGAYSYGVVIEAAGGRGGFRGGTTNTLSGQGGNAGEANFGQDAADGVISTSGNGAHALKVLSLGGYGTGAGSSGSITVDALGTIKASGTGASGIYARSTHRAGGGSTGLITINNGGTVSGGLKKETSNTMDGVGVFVIGGTPENKLTNNGTITFEKGTSETQNGVAIQFTQSLSNGALTVVNNGTINGSIVNAKVTDTTEDGRIVATERVGGSTGMISVTNGSSGTVFAGEHIDADVTNSGLFVGGSGASGTTVSGDFIQSASGSTRVGWLDGGSVPLVIDGAAFIAGTVGLDLSSSDLLAFLEEGPGSVIVLTASDGVELDALAGAAPSAAAQFTLRQPDDTTLRLGYDIDFTNDDILAATNDSQDSLARHLEELWDGGILADAAVDETLLLLAIESASEFAEAANSLSGEVYANTQLSTLYSAQDFSESLMSCADRDGTDRFIDEGQCMWLTGSGAWFDQDDNGTSTGFTQDSFLIQGGAQFDVASDTVLGFALAYQDTSIDMDHAGADGQQYWLGLSAKQQFGPSLLAASLAASSGDFDVHRNLATGGIASGTQDVWSVSGRVRGEYTFVQNDWYAKPRLDVTVDRVSSESFTESGAGAFNLDVAGQTETYFAIQPAVEFGGDIALDGGTVVRPTLTLGLTHFLGDTAPEANAVLTMAPDDFATFTSKARFDQTYFDLAAGLQVFSGDRYSVRADAFTSLSDNSQTYGGAFRFEITF